MVNIFDFLININPIMKKTKAEWVWFRSIPAKDESLWREKLLPWGEERMVFLQSNRAFFVHLYAITPKQALSLKSKWGGSSRKIQPYETSPEIQLDLFGRFRVQSKEIPKPDPKTLWVPAEMAFGTGDHPTTAMILREIMRHSWEKNERVLDVGCGSGILGLMARKCGAEIIHGFDNDPACVRISRLNETRNFEEPRIQWSQALLGKYRSQKPYDLILANLYSGLFQQYAQSLKVLLNPTGKMIVSGILRIDLPPTLAALEKAGFRLVKKQVTGKWVMLVFSQSRKTGVASATKGIYCLKNLRERK